MLLMSSEYWCTKLLCNRLRSSERGNCNFLAMKLCFRCLLIATLQLPQIDTAERGFSFLRDGPLDMRMDPCARLSAEEVIYTCSVFGGRYCLSYFLLAHCLAQFLLLPGMWHYTIVKNLF
jgi:hypothetical protein